MFTVFSVYTSCVLRSSLYMAAGTILMKHKLHHVSLLLESPGFLPHLEDKAKAYPTCFLCLEPSFTPRINLPYSLTLSLSSEDISQGATSDTVIVFCFSTVLSTF